MFLVVFGDVFFSRKNNLPNAKSTGIHPRKFFTVSPLKHDGTGRVKGPILSFCGASANFQGQNVKNFQGVPPQSMLGNLETLRSNRCLWAWHIPCLMPQPATWMTRVETACRIGVSFVPSYEALN